VNHYIHQFIASAQKLKGISVLFLLVAAFFLFNAHDLSMKDNSISFVNTKENKQH
jgi:hypothetical protein